MASVSSCGFRRGAGGDQTYFDRSALGAVYSSADDIVVVFLVFCGCVFCVGVSGSWNGVGERVAMWGDGEAMAVGVEVK
jgi:hypothetical protein